MRRLLPLAVPALLALAVLTAAGLEPRLHLPLDGSLASADGLKPRAFSRASKSDGRSRARCIPPSGSVSTSNW